MLHQMSVWVLVVALGLVLNYRLSINSRRLKNGNGNYYLTGKLIPNNKKTAGNNLWSNSIWPLPRSDTFKGGGDLNPGERHSRDTRDDGTVTLCTLRAASPVTRLSRRFWSSLNKECDVALA